MLLKKENRILQPFNIKEGLHLHKCGEWVITFGLRDDGVDVYGAREEDPDRPVCPGLCLLRAWHDLVFQLIPLVPKYILEDELGGCGMWPILFDSYFRPESEDRSLPNWSPKLGFALSIEDGEQLTQGKAGGALGAEEFFAVLEVELRRELGNLLKNANLLIFGPYDTIMSSLLATPAGE